jgi:hypothetical protein
MFSCGFHMQNALTLELWSQDSIHIPYDHAATLELGQLRRKLEKKNEKSTLKKFPLKINFRQFRREIQEFYKQQVRND